MKLTMFLALCVFVWGGEFWWASASQARTSASLASDQPAVTARAAQAVRAFESEKDVANVVATCMVIAGGFLISSAKPGRCPRVGGII